MSDELGHQHDLIYYRHEVICDRDQTLVQRYHSCTDNHTLITEFADGDADADADTFYLQMKEEYPSTENRQEDHSKNDAVNIFEEDLEIPSLLTPPNTLRLQPESAMREEPLNPSQEVSRPLAFGMEFVLACLHVRQFFVDFYCKNLINLPIEIPVVERFVLILTDGIFEIKPKMLTSTKNTGSMTRLAYRLKERKPTQLSNKINCVVINKLDLKSQRKNAVAYQMSVEAVNSVFKKGYPTVAFFKHILNSGVLFNTIFTSEFLESVLQKLNEDTQNDINVSIVDYVAPLAGHTLEELKVFVQKSFKQLTVEQQGEVEMYKSPFTFQDNIVAIITYLKDFMYQLKKMAGFGKNDRSSSEEVQQKMKGNQKVQFTTLLNFLNHYEKMLIEKGLVAEKEGYPIRKDRDTTGPKCLDFQSFVWVSTDMITVTPTKEEFPDKAWTSSLIKCMGKALDLSLN